MDAPELSIPVIWTENGAAPRAGRLDLYADRLQLDGGSRDSRARRDLRFDEIASARIGRTAGDRIHGRSALVVELAGGETVSFVGFDRPGTLIELLHRFEGRLATSERSAADRQSRPPAAAPGAPARPSRSG